MDEGRREVREKKKMKWARKGENDEEGVWLKVRRELEKGNNRKEGDVEKEEKRRERSEGELKNRLRDLEKNT